MNKGFLILLGAGLCFSAHAEIYKIIDANGKITYSNIPTKGAQRLNLEPLSTVSGGKPRSASVNNSTPANFPKVDGETQKKRDDMRRKLLNDELAAEMKHLGEAKLALSDGENVRLGNERNYQKYLDRVQGLRENVALHEKNIAALQKELANLK